MDKHNEAIKQFLTGDEESDKEVYAVAENGLAQRIEAIDRYIAFMFEKIWRGTPSGIDASIEELRKSIEAEYAHYAKMTRDGVPYWFRSMSADRIKDKERAMNKLSLKKKFVLGIASGMSPIAIQKAKNYPIENIIELRNGFAKCLWHEEKSGSMKFYPKTNSVYCFGCNKSGDSIDIFMKLNDVGFKDAVSRLSH